MSLGEEEREALRRAYYVERKSQRQIARESGRSREAVKQAVREREGGEGRKQGRGRAKEGLVYEPYRARVEGLLEESERQPAKQRYTAAKIYEVVCEEGYQGCESRIRPLDYEPGQDAQCDWGEALVVLGGREVKVQVFVMRMCYSRRLFVMAFPTQRRECFLSGHVHAFAYFGGVPGRISYDNVATAVKVTYEGEEQERKREERLTFVSDRAPLCVCFPFL
jgi:transposase